MTKAADPEKASKSVRAREKNERILYASSRLGQVSNNELAHELSERFDISVRQAWNDLSDAYARSAATFAEQASHFHQQALIQLDARIARNEELSDEAREKGQWGASAAFENAANYLVDKKCKLLGLYAPKKIQVSGAVNVNVSIRLDAIIGILDADGLAALELITRQIDAAKKKGLLAAPEPEKEAS